VPPSWFVLNKPWSKNRKKTGHTKLGQEQAQPRNHKPILIVSLHPGCVLSVWWLNQDLVSLPLYFLYLVQPNILYYLLISFKLFLEFSKWLNLAFAFYVLFFNPFVHFISSHSSFKVPLIHNSFWHFSLSLSIIISFILSYYIDISLLHCADWTTWLFINPIIFKHTWIQSYYCFIFNN
jgi:hypothetical protein